MVDDTGGVLSNRQTDNYETQTLQLQLEGSTLIKADVTQGATCVQWLGFNGVGIHRGCCLRLSVAK